MAKEIKRVTVFRTAMCGGGLTYDVYVAEKDCPLHVRKACPGGTYYTRICQDGGEYLDYEHATLPKEHNEMEQGWGRYESWLAHEKQARAEMLAIARRAFPELGKFNGDKLPQLWICGLMKPETSAVITLELA